jgi:hypothetical protein
MSFDTYVAYTEDTNTVVLNIPKLLLVGSTLLADFTYVRRNLAIRVSFVENEEVITMTITQFIAHMVAHYANSGKKLCIVDKYVEACKFIDYLIVKDKYTLDGKTTVPTHLRTSKIYTEGLSADELLIYMGDDKLPKIAATIVSNKKNQEHKNDGSLIDGNKQFSGVTVHSLDDILVSRNSKKAELLSLTRAMLQDELIKVTENEIMESLIACGEFSEAARAEKSLIAECGEFNAGWITAPSTPVGTEQEFQATRKAKFLAKFKASKYLIYYIKNPVTYFFVRSDVGRLYTSEKSIKTYLEVLPKVFHYVQMMAVGCKAIPDVFDQRVRALVSNLGRVMGGSDKNMVARMTNQLTFNRHIWFRGVDIVDIGKSKPKYLPTPVFVENVAEYNKDGKVENVDEVII